MQALYRALRSSLVDTLGKAVAGFEVREITEGGHASLTYCFEMYDYWVVIFSYDRGLYGFGIEQGARSVGLPEPGQRDLVLGDLPAVVRELDARVRLRIPDKYLEWYERSLGGPR